MTDFPILREPLLRLIRVIKADPPPDDFPVQWALAIEQAKSLPMTLAVAYKHTGDRQ